MSDLAAPQSAPDATGSITEREARAAVDVLKKVAGEYNATITYGELKAAVADITDRPSGQLTNTWADRVLGRVIEIAEQDALPRLTALVVRAADGGVGVGFNAILERAGRARIDEPQALELVAAEERLTAYRRFCDEVPDDAVPTLTREYREHVSRRTKPEPRARPTCPGCHEQLPATGICDRCE